MRYWTRTTHNFNNDTRCWDYRFNEEDKKNPPPLQSRDLSILGVHALNSGQWMCLHEIVSANRSYYEQFQDELLLGKTDGSHACFSEESILADLAVMEAKGYCASADDMNCARKHLGVSMSEKIAVQFKKLHPDAKVPQYQSDGAAGFDFCAIEEVRIPAGDQRIISTGICMAIPKGYEVQIRPRSGLAAKHMISVTNSPGTIDSDYRGEVKIMLINHANHHAMGVDNTFVVKPGDRIAQGVLSAAPQADIVEVKDLSETVRGAGGFGSTGV